MWGNRIDEMEAAPHVSIIILNWNGWKDTIECLESIYQITYPNYQVIVVDNGSKDESVEKIKEYLEGELEVTSLFFTDSRQKKPINYIEYTYEEVINGGGRETEIENFPSWNKLIIIKNGENYGFPEGNNIAIRYIIRSQKSKYILLLNNDTVVNEDFLEKMINICENEEDVGIIGPIIYCYDNKDLVQSAGVKICWYTGKQKIIVQYNDINPEFNQEKNVDYVSGCALLIKVQLIKKIGYLNPDYFMYWEETDWCVRALNAKYQVICTPKSKIWHKGGKATKIKNVGFYEYHMVRNMIWFMRQNATIKQYFIFILYFFWIKFWYTCISYLLFHRDFVRCKAFLKAVKNGFFDDINCKVS